MISPCIHVLLSFNSLIRSRQNFVQAGTKILTKIYFFCNFGQPLLYDPYVDRSWSRLRVLSRSAPRSLALVSFCSVCTFTKCELIWEIKNSNFYSRPSQFSELLISDRILFGNSCPKLKKLFSEKFWLVGPKKPLPVTLLQLCSIYMQSNYMQVLRKIAKSCHPKIFQLYAGFSIKFLL